MNVARGRFIFLSIRQHLPFFSRIFAFLFLRTYTIPRFYYDRSSASIQLLLATVPSRFPSMIDSCETRVFRAPMMILYRIKK